MIVHDLRNPLTGVISALDLLEGETLGEDLRRTVRLGRAAAAQVMDATRDLLQIRMLESNRLPLNLAVTPVAEVVRASVEAVRLQAQASDVEVRVDAEVDVELPLDEKLMRRALENLLANAIRHTRGAVDVQLAATPARVVIAVGDRGRGVPDELKEGLFEKFGSLELQRAGARRGHGLGLHLVRLVSQAHGGEVEIDDREGGGASFRLVLPRPATTA
jgi:signal transduction histidine kinase